jgi:hypothetical protein
MIILLFPITFFGFSSFKMFIFFFNPSEETESIITTINYSRFFTTVTYSYYVDDTLIIGKSNKDIIPILPCDNLNNIKFLTHNNKTSVIKSFIINNLVLNMISFNFFIFLFSLLLLGFIGKLPKYNQNYFNNYINKSVKN